MSVGEKAARGVAWNMVTGVGARAVGLVGTLLLTRFISPGEYGEVSAATICVGTSMMVANFSLGQYIIAKKATPDEAFHAAVVHVLLGTLGVLLVYVLRNRLAIVFDAPHMARFVPGFALAAMIDRLGYIPERTLVRDLRFRDVAISRGLGELTFTGTALACAPWWGGMAIIIANVVRSSLVTALFVRTANRRDWLTPARLQRSVFARLFAYCWPFSIASLADYASGRWDNLLVSRYFGAGLMGQYNLAYNLADTPTASVAEHIGDVLMPSFSKLELAARKTALLRAGSAMALLVFPLAVGLGAVAPTVVATFFDPRWVDVAPMLAILSVLSLARPFGWPLGTFLQAQQRPRLLLVLALLKIAFVLGAIVAFGRFGALWTCGAVGAAFTIYTLLVLVVIGIVDDVSVSGYLIGVARPLVACVVMAAAVVGARTVLRGGGLRAGWLSLLIEILVGAVVYALAAFVVARPVVDDVLVQVRRVLKRQRAAQ